MVRTMVMEGTGCPWWGQGGPGSRGIQWLCGDRVAVMAKGQQLCEDKAAVVAGGHRGCIGTGWL